MAAARPKSLTSVKNWQILNAIVSKSAGTNNRARIAYTDTETRIPEYLPIAVKNAPEITFFKDDIFQAGRRITVIFHPLCGHTHFFFIIAPLKVKTFFAFIFYLFPSRKVDKPCGSVLYFLYGKR